jgi:hypothetical protein
LEGDQPVARPLHTHKTTKGTQTSMPLVVFEPAITVFERAKTGHTCDREATVTGTNKETANENVDSVATVT